MATAAEADIAMLSLDKLEAELATLASHLYAGTCRWLELVAELDRRGGWAESGRVSCAEWLAWRCALTPRAAREHVRVARRLGELPLVHAAFARGELSYAKVRALTRVATTENEEELLELARVFTAAQLERAVRAYRRVSTAEACELQEDAYVSVFWNEDGSLEIHGRLAPEDGALLLRALDAMRDALWKRACGSAEPRPARQASNAEALVAVADAALAHPDESRPAGERYLVVVHVDEGVLSHDGEGGCELEDGSALASETAQRLACDASVVRNGRKTRAIPPALKRALRARDRGCRFPGCENRRFLDAHHVHHWARGVRRRSATWCCFAAATTGSSMRAAGRSTRVGASSPRAASRSLPCRRCRAAIPGRSSSAAATSESTLRPANPAWVSPSTSRTPSTRSWRSLLPAPPRGRRRARADGGRRGRARTRPG